MLDYIAHNDESQSLNSALEDAREGMGSVIVVDGPPGFGNSSLLKACVAAAEKIDAVPLVAISSPAESDIPLGVVGQLFQNVELAGERDTLLASIREEGERLGSIADHAPRGRSIRLDVLNLLHAAVMDITARAPLVITVDDVQHADAASREALLYLARRVGESRVVIVLGESSYMTPVDSDFHVELLRLPHCRYMRLIPLTLREVARLLDELIGKRESDARAADFFEISGGNPTLVRALAIDYVESRAKAKGSLPNVSPGARFHRAVVGILRRGELAILQLAQGMALLGEDVPLAVLNGAFGLAADVAPRAVQVLESAGILREGRFRHPEGRVAARQDLSPEEVADLSYSAARVLYEDGAAATKVAHYLLEGGVSDASWAVQVLEEAADESQSQEQFELAGKCLELAHECCQDDRNRANIKIKISGIAWHIRPTSVVRHLPPLVEAVRAGHLNHSDTVTLIRYLLWHGRFEDAVDALLRLSGTPDRLDRQTIGELHVIQMVMSANYPELFSRDGLSSYPLAETEPTPTEIVMNPRLQSASVLSAVLRRGVDQSTVGQAEQTLQRIRLLEKKGLDAVETAELALLSLVYAERLDKAGPWCDRLLGEDIVKGSPSWQAHILGVRAEIAMRLGDLPAARRFAEMAFSQMPMAAWGVGVGFPLSAAILAATDLGQYEEAAKLLAQPVPEAMFHTRYGLHYLYARGHHYLATGSHYAALADFLSCGELMRAWELDLSSLVPWRSAAAQALLKMDDCEQARHLVDEQLARLGTGRSRVRALTLRVLAATSELQERLQILTEAVEILEICGDRLELARTLADLSYGLHTTGQRSRARMVARRAYRVAMECGAEPLCVELQAGKEDMKALGSGVATQEDVSPLSDAELRVASLAAEGMTNREIAGKLFITVSTVEQHLTQIYRKLNVKHRRQLPYGLQTVMSETVMSEIA